MNYYDEIKKELLNNEITKKVKNYSINKSDLTTYYNIGKLLKEAGKHYGEGIIKEYSRRLTSEFGKGYTFTSLTRMKKFYNLIEKLATVSQHLSYGHYVELLPYSDIDKINYYIKITEEDKLSVRELRKNNKKYIKQLRKLIAFFRILGEFALERENIRSRGDFYKLL